MDLLDRFGMDEKERSRRLKFLDFTQEDADRLREAHGLAEARADEVIGRLYEHLLEFEETRTFFQDPEVLKRVKQFQKGYFLRLTEGNVDDKYFADRLKVGDAHQRIELLPVWYLGLYSLYLRLIIEQVCRDFEGPKAFEIVSSLIKLIFLDISLAIDAYIEGGFIDKLRHERKITEGLREELARKEKLAILGQLAGGVGHELRNPMAVIQTSTYFLKMAVKSDDPKISKHLGILEQELNNANEIISNLLDFSRVRQPKRVPTSLATIVNEAVGQHAHDRVETRLEIEDVIVSVDPLQIRQVLLNLVNNAVQAMPEGGTLRIGTGHDTEAAWLFVEDTGIGIDPANMEKIFQPLFTTKARGIGLGLAVCQQLLRANGGDITVTSERGKGSRFTVHFPIDGA